MVNDDVEFAEVDFGLRLAFVLVLLRRMPVFRFFCHFLSRPFFEVAAAGNQKIGKEALGRDDDGDEDGDNDGFDHS